MKRILLKQAAEGDVLARDIYGSSGNAVVLRKGMQLTERMIYSLIMQDVRYIWIEETTSRKTESRQEVHIEIGEYTRRLRETKEFKEFSKKYESNISTMKKGINNIVEKNAKEEDIRGLTSEIMYIVSQASTKPSVLDMLGNMKYYDDATFVHCMNVALICNVFARWLQMSEEDVETATACGLFHDIGKLGIPAEVIKKPGKLTGEEYDVVKTHTRKGYEILKDYKIKEEIKLAALMHHERCDGTGYPQGLGLDEINKFAQIVAIADVYDAMTSARVYRGPLCPFIVIQIFEEEGLLRYDPHYIMTFLENVADSYMQSEVRLSDGRYGKVVFINKNQISKPTVCCKNGTFVDLSKEKDLRIEEII